MLIYLFDDYAPADYAGCRRLMLLMPLCCLLTLSRHYAAMLPLFRCHNG